MTQQNTSAIVVMENNKYLLVQRRNPPFKNFWNFPGGHQEKKESIEECAQREANEEVGDVIVEKKSFFVFKHANNVNHFHLCHTFYGKVNGEIRAGDDAKSLDWFTLEQVKNIDLTPSTIMIFNKILGYE